MPHKRRRTSALDFVIWTIATVAAVVMFTAFFLWFIEYIHPASDAESPFTIAQVCATIGGFALAGSFL